MLHINSPHPERRRDEITITEANEAGFAVIGWKTKRKGMPRRAGKLTIFPVFAKRAELVHAGLIAP